MLSRLCGLQPQYLLVVTVLKARKLPEDPIKELTVRHKQERLKHKDVQAYLYWKNHLINRHPIPFGSELLVNFSKSLRYTLSCHMRVITLPVKVMNAFLHSEYYWKDLSDNKHSIGF